MFGWFCYFKNKFSLNIPLHNSYLISFVNMLYSLINGRVNEICYKNINTHNTITIK